MSYIPHNSRPAFMHMHLQTKTWLQKLTKLPNCGAHFILIKTIAGGLYSICVSVCVCVCRGQKLHLLYPPPAGDHCCLRGSQTEVYFCRRCGQLPFCNIVCLYFIGYVFVAAENYFPPSWLVYKKERKFENHFSTHTHKVS